MSIIHTINSPNEYKFKDKGSLFLGLSFPAENEEAVNAILTSVKKKYYDATHHCYSYKFLDGKFRYSDDGEPNGTAGLRIHNAIEHFRVLGVLVIVVRYFGGTKLGIGPLGKAYYNAAFNVLESSAIVQKKGYRKLSVLTDFNFMSQVYRIISGYDIKNVNTEYKAEVIISCYAEISVLPEIINELVEISGGKIRTGTVDEIKYI